MKIGIIKDCVYPYTKGGGELRDYMFAKEFVKMGHEVSLIGMKFWEGGTTVEIDEGITGVGITRKSSLYTSKGVRSLRDSIAFMQACSIYNLEDHVGKVDMLLTDHVPYLHLGNVQAWAQHLKIPVFVTWHEYYGYKHWLKERFLPVGITCGLIEKWVMGFGDRVVAVSERTKDRLLKAGGDEGQVIVVEGGLDNDGVDAVTPFVHTSDVIYSTRMVRHKRVDLFLKAMKLAEERMFHSHAGKKLKIVLTGDGPLKPELERLAGELNLDVRFTGWIPSLADVWGYMKSSKVMVHTSEREGFGFTALEAMACGLPVVTSNEDSNAINQLVTHGYNGYISDPTVEGFATGFIRMYNQRLKSNLIPVNAKVFAKKYSWTTGAEKLIKEYENVR